MMSGWEFRQSPRRWLLLAGASLTIFLEVGMLKSYGVFVNDITVSLQTSTGLVGLITGLAQGLSYILAPTNRLLLRYLSPRQLYIFGALIGCLFYMSASFSRTITQFAVALTMSGLGYNFVMFPTHALPANFFSDSEFDVTSSILIGAGGVGMMVLPVIAERLSIAYGWRGAMLLLGTFSLHNVTVGALMVPVPKGHKAVGASKSNELGTENDTKSGSHNGTKRSVNLAKNTVLQSSSEHENLLQDRRERISIPSDAFHMQNGTRDTRVPYPAEATTSFKKQEELDSAGDETDYLFDPSLSKKSDQGDKVLSRTDEGTLSKDTAFPGECLPESLWTSFKLMTGLDIILRKKSVFSVLVTMFWLGISYSGWTVFVVPNGIAKGYHVETSVVLATIGGAANIVGRYSIGFITKSESFSSRTIFVILAILSAVAYAINNFTYVFWALCILSILNGSTLGAMTTMINVLSRDAAPEGEVAGVISLSLAFLGAGVPIGGFLIGSFFDQSKSYDQAFSFLGLTNILAALSLLVPSIYHYITQLIAR